MVIKQTQKINIHIKHLQSYLSDLLLNILFSIILHLQQKNIHMNQIFNLYKQQILIQFQLFHSTQTLLISIHDKSQQKKLLFEQHFKHSQLYSQDHIITLTWETFCQALKYLIEQTPYNILFDAEGEIIIKYHVSALGNSVEKEIKIKLKRKLEYQDQVRILREKVCTYEGELRELKKLVEIVRIDNVQLSARISCLEQLNSRKKKDENGVQTKKKEVQLKSSQQQGEKVGQTEQEDVNQEKVKLSLDIDPSCPFYTKFKIQDNKLTSLFEDYFQVYWSSPLPKKGISQAFVKIPTKNHFSIGILHQSALSNQYSFQKDNSICLYTYADGAFRGLYIKKTYQSLEWDIRLDQIIAMEINTIKGTLTVDIKGGKVAEVIDIKEFCQNQKIYFFVETYEKDNVFEFL